MDDKEVLARIGHLVAEEHELREQHLRRTLSTVDERERLQQLEVALDQCWDLLRQRRARLQVGQNPDEAHVRPASQVENYLQ
ncbi:DUF2630 family protein [Micromonospora sp. CB01531]|uniref:DUF2630 family protein n=1 Tax=Micromonospora sp. CB01531 TaxID=1718947 RepID=UPI000938CD54|nr:DUF2630 family protein [Micromonospora sp. CB01531]OKI44020.1 hypothetical protein A6A27_38680 [Micromonospora sp. CB01531]